MALVKICGITNLDDALFASEAGADALGFVLYKKSPRYIEPKKARDIIKRLPPFVTTVGVFADQTEAEIKGIISETDIDIVQLHGEEPPEFCEGLNKRVIKAIRVRGMENLTEVKRYKACALLLDTYDRNLKGGTGKIFNWEIAREAKVFNKIIIAGGLTPDNVADAIRVVQPYAVDVSSGVEKQKGLKDHLKVKAFIYKVKRT